MQVNAISTAGGDISKASEYCLHLYLRWRFQTDGMMQVGMFARQVNIVCTAGGDML